jgi:ubiquinone/menaquinone biosynthesis C-methylase UbiE
MEIDHPPTSDYTPVAEWYDQTRNMPEKLLVECFDRFFAAAGYAPPKTFLDAGCGTAQLSVPLMAAGYAVVGVDVSEAMLARARAKVEPGWSGEFLVGDVRDMPFPDGHFDAVVVSKLFQHVPSWQSAVDEIHRVTRPEGHLLHINEKGAFKNNVRVEFAKECDRRGYADRYHGLRDRTQLATYVQETGGRRLEIDLTGLDWKKEITYGEALEHLRLKLHSEFWSVPDDDYQSILATVESWVDAQPEGKQTVEKMSPYLTAEIFQWTA